jgi:hypothetical protein
MWWKNAKNQFKKSNQKSTQPSYHEAPNPW